MVRYIMKQDEEIVRDGLPRHGSPQDRGSADRYYQRPYEPHKYEGATGKSPRITELTEKEIAAYDYGWKNEEDRKDWG